MRAEAHTIKNSKPSSDGSWRTALWCLSLSLLTLFIVFFNTFATMVLTWWQSGTFAHGFLVLPIVAFLIWTKRHSLRLISPSPRKSALLLVLVLLLAWFFAYILNVLFVMQFSVVALMVALVWMFLGDHVVSKLAFPLGYLFFAVPFGDFLIPTLQDITALLTVKALQLSSIPVYLEGWFFYIPSGSFEVAEGCSGVRYLIASISLGTLYSYLLFGSIKRRILFIVFCAIVPILANAIRAYGIVMIAHLSDYKYAVGVDHIIYGWFFFGVVILFVFWIGSYFRDTDDVLVEDAANVAIRKKPEMPKDKTDGKKIDYIPLTLSVTILMLAGSWWVGWVYSSSDDVSAINPSFPKGDVGWQGPVRTESIWQPEFFGATYQNQVEYTAGNKAVEVYISYYARQQQGAELISTRNKIYNEDWKRRSEASITINGVADRNWTVSEVVIASARETRIVWFWYDIGGYQTNNRVLAKIIELPIRLLGKNKGSSVFAVSTQYDLEIEAGRRDLKEFLNNMLLPLQAMVVQPKINTAGTY